MTSAQILRQMREARRTMRELAKLFPGAFDKRGRPIVATLRPEAVLEKLNARP